MDDIKIELSVQFGELGEELRCRVTIDRHIAQCLRPLPKNHDSPLDAVSFEAARQQREERSFLVRWVGVQLRDALMELVEQQDTVNGYPKETSVRRPVRELRMPLSQPKETP